MNTRGLNFKELIDAARRSGRAAHLRPRSMIWAARGSGLSVPYLYALCNGTRAAPQWTVYGLAGWLGVKTVVVERALARTQECKEACK